MIKQQPPISSKLAAEALDYGLSIAERFGDVPYRSLDATMGTDGARLSVGIQGWPGQEPTIAIARRILHSVGPVIASPEPQGNTFAPGIAAPTGYGFTVSVRESLNIRRAAAPIAAPTPETLTFGRELCRYLGSITAQLDMVLFPMGDGGMPAFIAATCRTRADHDALRPVTNQLILAGSQYHDYSVSDAHVANFTLKLPGGYATFAVADR